MEVNGAPGGGGHAPRSKRPALPNHHSWRSQLEGEGQGLRASQQGVLCPLDACPLESDPFFAGSYFCLENAWARRRGEAGDMETGNPESQTPLCVDVGVREERLAAQGQRPISPVRTSGTAGPRGGRPGSRSRENQGWGGRTPTEGSGRREGAGRGSWGRWLRRRGQEHTERRRRLLPLPRVGAPSRALIGAAAAAGRVSAASLRDATPSNCGQDRRYAAASCPGAWPGRPRPRPAPRPARPSASRPRGDTEARQGGYGLRGPGPDRGWRVLSPRLQTSRSVRRGASIPTAAGAAAETPQSRLRLAAHLASNLRTQEGMSRALR